MISITAAGSVRLKAPDRLFVGGEWVAPGSSGWLSVISPVTEEEILRVAEGREADMDRAVADAREAFDRGPWPRMPGEERARHLLAVADELERRESELADAWTAQVGAPIGLTRYAVTQAAGLFRYYAGLARTLSFEDERRRADGKVAKVLREPVGVVAAITPWNAPLVLLCYKLAAALAAGCTVVAKPSPETPLDAYIVAECAEAAGLPRGVLSVIPAGREVGDYLVRHPGIDKVSFTGSSAAGKHIAEVCAQRLARVSLELGGKSAAIVLDDAAIEDVLPDLVPFSVPITGQVCFSLTRVLVPKARHDAFVGAYKAALESINVGDPSDPETQMGPLAMARQRDRVEGYIRKGLAEGATLVTGGARPARFDRGYFIEPTLFTNVDNRMTIAQEEIFGPVVSIIAYDDVNDAVQIANDSVYGLHGAVYTGDVERGYEVARRVRTGSVSVNRMAVDYTLPFGGFKQSGLGREGGPEGLDPYLEVKTVYFP
jgi:acyl-CoA reductase-like NAD-dependent aldehyde dehydrogenase